VFCIAPHFIPYALANVVLLSPIYMGRRGGTQYYILPNRAFYYGEYPQFHFFRVMGQSNWLVAKDKKIELRRHLI
jgi:hypothetical protein